eukprot:COSAG01_NODE_1915_length_8918_cov_21.920853_2_plen_386_part_00
MPARAAGGLAAAVVAPAADESGGVWCSTNRWIVPSQNPAATNLVDVRLAPGGGDVRSLTIQGKNVPLVRPFQASAPHLLAAQLDRTAMCVGVVCSEKVGYARGKPQLRHRVQDGFDGSACFAWNDVVRQGACFTVAAGRKRWRGALHAASAAATATVRAEGCTRYVVFGAGEQFQPNCVACSNFDKNTLKVGVAKAADTAAMMVDPARAEEAAAVKARRLGAGTNDRYLQESEIKEKREVQNRKLSTATRRIKGLKKAAELREATGVPLDMLGKDAGGQLHSDDYQIIMNDPRVQAEAKKEFGEEESMRELLWADDAKYRSLRDKRGMRHNPKVLRWALLFWTRANPAAYDEVASILHLPSRRTLRGYVDAAVPLFVRLLTAARC